MDSDEASIQAVKNALEGVPKLYIVIFKHWKEDTLRVLALLKEPPDFATLNSIVLPQLAEDGLFPWLAAPTHWVIKTPKGSAIVTLQESAYPSWMPKPASAFKRGDLVRLKSGSPVMIVVKQSPPSNWLCCWMSDNKIYEEAFPEDFLVLGPKDT